MTTKHTRQRLVDLAIGLVGFIEIVRWLDVEPEVIDGWLSGTTSVPDDKVLAVLDLVDSKYRH
jgi:hypothetical protein